MSPRAAGAWIVAAALLFWLAWALMPAVGITDTRQIFEHVAAQAACVRASVILQLASAACYAPALVGIARSPEAGRQRTIVLGAVLLLIGAMGSAADAVLHLLAVEMVAPGIDRDAMIAVMQRMQGPNLALLGPLIAAFFAGSIALAVGAALEPMAARIGAPGAPVRRRPRTAGLRECEPGLDRGRAPAREAGRMSPPEWARTLTDYNRWMNERLYACCAGLSDAERKRDRGAFFRSVHGTLNHLLLGDRLWLSRFTGTPFVVAYFEGTLRYTSVVSPAAREVPFWAALTHLFNHQAHHRGQLTTLLVQAGVDPGVTDLIWLPELQPRS